MAWLSYFYATNRAAMTPEKFGDLYFLSGKEGAGEYLVNITSIYDNATGREIPYTKPGYVRVLVGAGHIGDSIHGPNIIGRDTFNYVNSRARVGMMRIVLFLYGYIWLMFAKRLQVRIPSWLSAYIQYPIMKRLHKRRDI